MLFKKKEQYKNASDCFFGEIKKALDDERKDIKRGQKDMSDIDKSYKVLSKKYDKDKVFYGLILREEEPLLEILYRILLIYNGEKIEIQQKEFDILTNDTYNYFFRAFYFIERLLSIYNIDEITKIGFCEAEFLTYKEIFNMEKKRIEYIGKIAQKNNIKIENVDVRNWFYYLIEMYKQMQEECNASQEKNLLLRNIMKTFPDDAFNRGGLSPFQLKPQ